MSAPLFNSLPESEIVFHLEHLPADEALSLLKRVATPECNSVIPGYLKIFARRQIPIPASLLSQYLDSSNFETQLEIFRLRPTLSDYTTPDLSFLADAQAPHWATDKERSTLRLALYNFPTPDVRRALALSDPLDDTVLADWTTDPTARTVYTEALVEWLTTHDLPPSTCRYAAWPHLFALLKSTTLSPDLAKAFTKHRSLWANQYSNLIALDGYETESFARWAASGVVLATNFTIQDAQILFAHLPHTLAFQTLSTLLEVTPHTDLVRAAVHALPQPLSPVELAHFLHTAPPALRPAFLGIIPKTHETASRTI